MKHKLLLFSLPGSDESGLSETGPRNLMRTLPPMALLCLLSIAGIQHSAGQDFTKQTYTYKTAGDLHILADVYRKNDNLVRPAILWIHGGALIGGSRRTLNQVQAEKYLSAGYTVISIDYRLAPQVKLPLIIEDLRDAYQWVRSTGPEVSG